MRSRRIYEIRRHYQSGVIFDKTTTKEKDARVLYWACLTEDCQVYTDFEYPEIGHERPFHYEIFEGKHFMFSSKEDRATIQLQILTDFLKGGGQLRVLEEI